MATVQSLLDNLNNLNLPKYAIRKLRARIRRAAPKDTGKLRRSIELTADGSGIAITDHHGKVGKLEFESHSRQAPNGFIRVNTGSDDIDAILKEQRAKNRIAKQRQRQRLKNKRALAELNKLAGRT